MDTTLDDLKVVISSNAAEFTKELKKVQDELKKVGATTQNVSAKTASWTVALQMALKVLGVIGKAIIRVVKGLGRLVVSVAKSGMEFTRLKIATQTVAQNMGITADEVENLRNQLAEANTFGSNAEEVIRTLATSGLVEMASSLKAVDARTGEVVTGVSALVLGMKDLAASTGRLSSTQGIVRLTKFINRGTADDAESVGVQIGNMGTEYRMFAESVGKSRSELTAQEEAFVRMKIVTREAEKAFGAYANTNQTAGKTMASVGDVINRIKELLGASLEPLLGAFSNALLEFLNGIRKFLIENENAIRKFVAKFTGYMITLIRVIGVALSKIPLLGKYFEGLKTFSLKPIRGIADGINDVGENADDSSESVSGLRKELGGLASFDEMNILSKPEMRRVDAMDASGADVEELFDAIRNGELMASFNQAVDQANSVANSLLGPFRSLGDRIQGILQSDLVTKITETFVMVRDDVSGWIGDFNMISSEGLAEFVNGFMLNFDEIKHNTKEFISGEIDAFNQMWIDLIDPVISPMMDGFVDAWDNGLDDVVNSLGEFVGRFYNLFLVINTNFFQPIRRGLMKVLAPAFGWFGDYAGDSIRIAGAMIANSANGIMGVLNGLLQFITGVFSRRWNDVWYGMKRVFNSTIGSLGESLKWVLNRARTPINRFIRAIRNITIPDWVPEVGGGRVWIPTIPRLAEGGIVDSPTLAQIGEGGRREAVLPLDRNTEWMDELAERLEGKGDGGINGNLVVKIGDDTIYERAISYIKDKNLRSGENILNI